MSIEKVPEMTLTCPFLVLRVKNRIAMPSMHTVTMCHRMECANQFRWHPWTLVRPTAPQSLRPTGRLSSKLLLWRIF